MTTRWIQPRKEAPQTTVQPPFPWDRLRWPEGVTIAVSARFGIGKSSSAALLGLPGPDGSPPLLRNWITTEQDPGPVQAMFKRLGVPIPHIWSADPGDPLGSVKHALRTQVTGVGAVTVLDSTTPLGIDGAVEVMNLVVQDGLSTGRRYWLISQQNKQREIFGKVALAFIPDVMIDIEVDDFGRRRAVVTKNRHGSTSITYFAFDDKGCIIRPDFQTVAHSVEGSTSGMQLVPYGLKVSGMRWDGLLKALDQHSLLPNLTGYASAALATGATRSGFLAPPDEAARRRLAEAHDLTWLTIEQGVAMLDIATTTVP